MLLRKEDVWGRCINGREYFAFHQHKDIVVTNHSVPLVYDSRISCFLIIFLILHQLAQ